MSFASSLTPSPQNVPTVLREARGHGRGSIEAHVQRWMSAPASVGGRAALVVLDVDLDDALPFGDRDDVRRHRLGRTVQRVLSAHARPDDAVTRVDAGRFALLRGGLADDVTARAAAASLARTVEDALVGRPEGYGARITAGAATLEAGSASDPRETLRRVTSSMLEGKLLTDDRVVVVVARIG